jgi:hypothetical protein
MVRDAPQETRPENLPTVTDYPGAAG